jgi:hypothetical protein
MRIERRLARIGRLFTKNAEAQARATRTVKTVLICVGTLLAGCFQFITYTSNGIEWSKMLGVFGVALVFVGSWWTIQSEIYAPQALEEARRALEDVRNAQEAGKISRDVREIERHALNNNSAELSNIFDKIKDASLHDRQIIALSKTLIEICSMINGTKIDVAEKLSKLINLSERVILSSIRVLAGERWAISIYKAGSSELVRIFSLSADRVPKGRGRSWPIGEGFVGVAYEKSIDIVLEEVEHSEFGTLSAHIDQSDAIRYRSIAAIIIRDVLNGNDAWGVLIVTSNMKGRFGSSIGSEGFRNVDAVKLLANAIELVVSSDRQ